MTDETVSEAEAVEAVGNIRWLTECRCGPAWTERKLHAPGCLLEYREDVDEALAAAERGGYKRAIAALRDDEGWERWFIHTLGVDDAAFTARDNQNAANYLESLTTEGTKP